MRQQSKTYQHCHQVAKAELALQRHEAALLFLAHVLWSGQVSVCQNEESERRFESQPEIYL